MTDARAGSSIHRSARARTLSLALLACLLLFSACASTKAPEVIDARLGETVVLERGDLARFQDADLTVRFDSVANDTRCPEDVACAERGAASAHFMLLGSDSQPVTPFVLRIAGHLPSDATQTIQEAATSDPEIPPVLVEGHPARLYLLQPYPGFKAEQKMTPTAVLAFGEGEL